MDSVKYIGMDVHKEAISLAVLNSSGKLVMECTIETKAITIFGLSERAAGKSACRRSMHCVIVRNGSARSPKPACVVGRNSTSSSSAASQSHAG